MNTKAENTQNGNTKVYSPEKIAEMMEVKKSFVLRMLREGKLEGFRMGKFWRISEGQLNAFLTAMSENGNGKRRMSSDTKEKIRFHTHLKSQDSLPGTVEGLQDTIMDLKERLENQSGYKKVATIAKLYSAIQLREELKTRIGSMDKTLRAIGSKAYPEFMELADQDADALERMFVENAHKPKQRMVDTLDKEVREMMVENGEGEDDNVNAAKVQNING